MKQPCFFAAVLGLLTAGAVLPVAAPAFAQSQSQSDLGFRLDPAQRQANWDKIADEIAKADRNIAPLSNDVRNALRAQDIVGPYMEGYGMSSADLGDVLALAYFSAVILADGGRTDDPTQAQIDGIRKQIASAGAGQFARLSDPQKQEAADQLLYLIILQNAVAEGLQGQPALNQWMDAFAKTNSAMLGFDVTQVKLGPNGFDIPAARAAPSGSATSLAALQGGPVGASQSAANRPASMGTGASDILGVDWVNNLIFMPGPYGGALQQTNTITVLLRDGRACMDCIEDVLKGDFAAVGARDPRDVGKWRKSGAKYLVTFDDGDTDEIEASRLKGPAPRGKTFNARFKGVSGTSVGIANTLTVDFLDFRSDGTFSADGGTSSLGIYATASIERATQTGRYTIDGYRLILDFNNGKREETSFVLWDRNPEELVLIIDEVPHFIPDD